MPHHIFASPLSAQFLSSSHHSRDESIPQPPNHTHLTTFSSHPNIQGYCLMSPVKTHPATVPQRNACFPLQHQDMLPACIWIDSASDFRAFAKGAETATTLLPTPHKARSPIRDLSRIAKIQHSNVRLHHSINISAFQKKLMP